ncbi:MAG: hypothetical protein AB8G14_03295 [Ilumatobacter sp.]
MTRRSTLWTATAGIVVGGIVAGGAAIAVRDNVTAPDAVAQAEPLVTQARTVTDDLSDSDFAEGDIVSSTLEASSNGLVTATLVVDEFTDPSTDAWQFGDTSVTWFVDTDDDDNENGRIRMDVNDGELRAGVLGRRNNVRCLGEPVADAATRSYSVTFSAACLGNPEQLRFRTSFEFDDVAFDLTDSDRGPESGWSPFLSNPAFVGPLVTLDPDRLFDSREGPGRRMSDSETEVVVTGRAGVPDDALAVLLNVTAIRPDGKGFVTVFPCGFPRAETSNLNYQPGATIANAVMARVGIDGKVCFYTSGGIDLAVDVNGYVPALSDVGSLPPARLLDTRDLGEAPAAGSITRLRVTDRSGVPADAEGVVLNVTAVRPAARGFMTVYPCGGDVPLASNLNFTPGENVPNAVVAAVGEDGEVCVFTSQEAHIIVDVNGFLPTGTRVEPLEPERVLDTRDLGDRRAAESITQVKVAGVAGVPGDASGVILNVTAVQPEQNGFFTVFPCGGEVPLASNLNYRPGSNVPNAVVARIGDDGEVCVFTRRAAHVIVDVNGFVP